MAKKTSVGGQAVIEGVMMRGEKGIATAVRLENGEIEVDFNNSVPFTKKHSVLNIPIIRGFVAMIESLVIGMKTLNYSASCFEGEAEPSKFEKWLASVFKDKSNDVILGFALIVSLMFSVGLFFILPTFLSNLLYKLKADKFTVNIIEGILRVGIFILYIYFVGKMSDIRRVFEYHGAEHKTIFCYENEEELTAENAAKFVRFHPRCGTNFLFIVMIVSIVLFSLVEFNSLWEKIVYRVILLPIVAGVSYELIKWLGKSKSRLSDIIAYPGLKLQNLTTNEPDESQLEVAIIALKAAEGIDYSEDIKRFNRNPDRDETQLEEAVTRNCGNTVGELLNTANAILKENDIESYIIDSQLIMAKALDKTRIEVMTNREAEVSEEQAQTFWKMIKLRQKKMPVKYIIKQCEFMGINLYIDEGVLIPRPDTEVLVEEAVKIINNKQYNTVCDVCCGSGAIGIAIANEVKNTVIECYDISEDARKVTERNILDNNFQQRMKFYNSDMLNEAIKGNKKFDIIVCNPPYIPEEVIPTLMGDVKDYEPYIALCGGKDGLDFYKKISEQAVECMNSGGVIVYEIGDDQKMQVEYILKENGFSDIYCVKDLAGRDRVIVGHL